MNGSVKAAAFSPDSNTLYSVGGEAEEFDGEVPSSVCAPQGLCVAQDNEQPQRLTAEGGLEQMYDEWVSLVGVCLSPRSHSRSLFFLPLSLPLLPRSCSLR